MLVCAVKEYFNEYEATAAILPSKTGRLGAECNAIEARITPKDGNPGPTRAELWLTGQELWLTASLLD